MLLPHEHPRLDGKEIVPSLGKSWQTRQRIPVLGSVWHVLNNSKGNESVNTEGHSEGVNRTGWGYLEEELLKEKTIFHPVLIQEGSPGTDTAQAFQCLFCCFWNCALVKLFWTHFQKVSIRELRSYTSN